jgi:acyl-CoA synthetase (AMP-forming)/AMP-acid ligase II
LIELYPHLELSQGYGMTESSAVLTFLTADDHRAGGVRLRSAGRPVPGVVLSIHDEEGNVLPRGQTGEVCAKAGNFMREYWNKPEATEEAFAGGWYHTGDAGYLDEGGYLFLVDRVKDMIVTGGSNVYAREVEDVLIAIAGVERAAVIGLPHRIWGEEVTAVLVRAEGSILDDDAVIAHCRQALAGYKVPKRVVWLDELPTNSYGKILKRNLRSSLTAQLEATAR